MLHFEPVFFIALFGTSVGVSWLIHSWKRPILAPPIVGTRVRLRRGASVSVCRVLGRQGRCWKLSAPIIKAGVTPLRPSDSYLACYTTDQGLATFFTRIVARQFGEEPVILIKAPYRVNYSERRAAERKAFLPGVPVCLGPIKNCELRDISARGALVNCPGPLPAGGTATLEVKGVRVAGAILSCERVGSSVWPGYNLRVLFGERLSSNELAAIK